MTNTRWTWAQLTDDQVQRLAFAEQTLGADILLVYQPLSQAQQGQVAAPEQGLRPASLNDGQLECLHGLEAQLQAVVIAYKV